MSVYETATLAGGRLIVGAKPAAGRLVVGAALRGRPSVTHKPGDYDSNLPPRLPEGGHGVPPLQS
ncbi:MAG TPA: hypothetical protein VMS31_22130 [Pyrinomonadaceae bacterium]|nr:hypothetical protein [Pyrinomonadaceae bacterium]